MQKKTVQENESAVKKLKEELQIATNNHASTSHENEVSSFSLTILSRIF